MKNSIIIITAFLILLLNSACEKQVFGLQHTNDPLGNFDALWEEYNELYGLFRLKGIDWVAMRATYRSRLSDESTDAELYEVLVEMLDELNDGHVGLIPVGTNLPSYFGGVFGSLDTMADFDLDLLTENYLSDPRETDFAMRYDFVSDNIGYVHIDNFADGERAFDKEMGQVLDFFQSAEALIIDIRGAGGGEDIAGKTIASHFTDQERLYMTTSIKNGPGANDFTTPEQWFISPRGDRQFLKPVLVLTNRFTISARETFCLAMRTLPQVMTVGDTTAGAFSNQINREMPNGWGYSVSIGEWRTADGSSFEGQGIPPQILVRNKREDVLNGKDEVLEKAVELLQ
ncbi:MAG: S41 family peptidase [Cyanothece sp. SIO1E1]|nr:S41 family peptidase [Cyanothece sp. SIO1E1]